MRILNKKFKVGIDNQNNAITPIVTLGKHTSNDGLPEPNQCITISTKYFTQSSLSQDNYIFPLLLNFPSASTSLDVSKGAYKTSQFTFQVANTTHDGKTLSEHLSLISNTGLINQEVGFFLASESNQSFSDCLKVYSGIIIDVTNNKKTITIKCEDYSSQVLEKNIPYSKINFEDGGKFTNISYPMNYGYFIYSRMYLKADDDTASFVGVYDNPSSFYGDNHLKGIHFFDGISEARMSKTHTGLFGRYNEVTDQIKGNMVLGGEQWREDSTANRAIFSKLDGNGNKNFFGDNEFEAEFHFNKLGNNARRMASSNMAFESINIAKPEDLVDASESKKFPLLNTVLGMPASLSDGSDFDWDIWGNGTITNIPEYFYQTWANTSYYFIAGEFLQVAGNHISNGILYNNNYIENEKNLIAYNEHYTTENEYLRIIDFSDNAETYVAGEIGMGADAINTLWNFDEEAETQSGEWYSIGATSGVDCIFEQPPQMTDNQRVFFTLEMDLIARIENTMYEMITPHIPGNYPPFQTTDIDNFAQILGGYTGSYWVEPHFSYPGELAGEDRASLQMPCQPSLLYWIDDKPAGGWYACNNIVNDEDPDQFPSGNQGIWQGIHIKTGKAFGDGFDNLRSLTFSKLKPEEFNTSTGEDYQFDFDKVASRVLGQGSEAFKNETIYNGFAEVTGNIGMFVDYGSGSDAWMNQNKDRGAFTVLSNSTYHEFKEYLPNEIIENTPDLSAFHFMLDQSYGLRDTQVFFTERGQSPGSLSLNMWDSSMARSLTDDYPNAFPGFDNYYMPDSAEMGEMWIKSLGYYMIYIATDFRTTEFYAYLKNGRRINEDGENAFLLLDFINDSNKVISNPVAVFSDVLATELAYDLGYDQSHPKYGLAWEQAFLEHSQSPIWILEGNNETFSYSEPHRYGFSLSDNTAAKSFFSSLAYESRVRPYFDGKNFSFITIKQSYNPIGLLPDVIDYVYGCTDEAADNYYVDANIDDGSCLFSGCTNPAADNYNPDANVDDGSCNIDGIPESQWQVGCSNDTAITLEEAQILFDEGVIETLSGYYNPNAQIFDDETCIFAWEHYDTLIYGCMDENALNYNPGANLDNGECSYDTTGYEIKVQFTLVTHSGVPVAENLNIHWVHRILGVHEYETAQWDDMYGEYCDLQGENDEHLQIKLEHISAAGYSFQDFEGDVWFRDLTERPSKSLIIHPFPIDLFDTSSYDEVTQSITDPHNNIFIKDLDNINFQVADEYRPYFQNLDNPSDGYGVIGAGGGIYNEYNDNNYYTPNYQTGFGLLVDSIVLEHEKRIPLESGAVNNDGEPWEYIVRYYTVEATLPRPNSVVYNSGGAANWEWQYFHPQEDCFSNPTFSTYLTNDWIYDKFDQGGIEALDGLFDFSYITENLLSNDSPLNSREAGMLPVGVTSMGISYVRDPNTNDYFEHGGGNCDFIIQPGTAVSRNRGTWGGGNVIESTCTQMRIQNYGNYDFTMANQHPNPYPMAFIAIKSFNVDDNVGYCYPNQSMIPFRNPENPLIGVTADVNESVTGSYRFGGVKSNSFDGKMFSMNMSPFNVDNMVGSRTTAYSDTRTDMLIDGTYAPIGINWNLELMNSGANARSQAQNNDRNTSDISKLVKKIDVINYKIQNTRKKDVVGRCRVKFNSAKGDNFEFGTDYFYWYDIPSVKQYYQDQNITTNDTMLQDFYNINSKESSDEDGNATRFKDCELNIESKYINDVHSARALAQFLLGWNMNTHTKIEMTLPFSYVDLEIGDIIAIDKLLGDDLIINDEDYSYENFISNVEDGVIQYTTRLGQVILPMFMIEKLKINSNMTITISTIQMHDWAGLKAYNSDVQLTVGATPPPLEDGVSEEELVYGCTDEEALNYDASATINYGCLYPDEPDEEELVGDVNGDGNVDILDIVTMVQMIQGSATATDAADVNDDGMVNILDVVTVIQIIIN